MSYQAADLDQLVRRMLEGLLDRVDDKPPLDACETTWEFVDRYALTIDGQRFDWDGYSHWKEGPYSDMHRAIVAQTGAQCGKSVWVMARLLQTAIVRWGAMFGYYFPDYHLPRAFSTQRFKPFVESSPELARWLGRNATQGEGTNAVFTRTFGASSIFFLSVKGTTSTEGLPMAGIIYDEVRRMAAGDVQRAEERTSAQKDPINLKVSTARYPETDINAYFLGGDQRYFHTDCDCPNGVVLAQSWPDCIADLRTCTPALRAKVAHAFEHAGMPYLGMTPDQIAEFGEAAYRCPKCGKILTNPREGWWEPHNPGAWTHSYQLPQMLQRNWPAARIWSYFTDPNKPLDLMEFWNSKLGMPYLDEEARGVQLDHLRSCIETGLRWAAHYSDAWRRKHLKNTSMGVDAMGGYNCVVIKQRAPNGKYRTIHAEVLHGDDPWKQTARLMHVFNVRVCVADCNPHWNEAMRFAKAFAGRVWLCVYTEEQGTKGKGSMISWKDRKKAPADQKGRDASFKYMVGINKYKGMKWSLDRWKEGRNEIPDPRQLVQQLPRQGGKVMLTTGLTVGRFEPVPIAQDLYFDHLMRIIFRKEHANEDAQKRGDFKMVVENLGGVDPHFAHANLYADIGMSRIAQRGTEDPE